MGQNKSTLKPQAVDDLMRMTDFNDQELNKWYFEFKKDAHSDRMTKEEFIKLFESIFPQGNALQVANHTFRTFDANNDGVLNFREFIIGLSLQMKGTLNEKLHWAFKLYDVDGNGYITYSELNEIKLALKAVCRKKFPNTSTDELFVALDTNDDGRVSWAEFRKGFYENTKFTKFLEEELNCVKPE